MHNIIMGQQRSGKSLHMYNMMLSMDYEYKNIRNGKEVIDVEPKEINGVKLID